MLTVDAWGDAVLDLTYSARMPVGSPYAATAFRPVLGPIHAGRDVTKRVNVVPSAFASSRETCIWEMPISAAISLCDIDLTNRNERMRRSRSGSRSSAGPSVTESSTRVSSGSSWPSRSASDDV